MSKKQILVTPDLSMTKTQRVRSWRDAPSGDGWYWVYLTRPYPRGLYMTLLFKGRHVYLLSSDGSIPSGGQVKDVSFARGKWWGPLVPPAPPGPPGDHLQTQR